MKKIIIIVLVVLVGVGVYVLSGKKVEKITEPVASETPIVENQNNEENSVSEIFKNQPGAIKTITNQNDGDWSLSIDLLTKNPNWRPGGETEFFINQNPKVRSLLVTKDTKTYECDGVNADAPRNTSNFIANIQAHMAKMEAESQKFGTKRYDYTAYFDINGSNIIAIYEQCLP